MQVDVQVLKQTEITLKHIAKRLREEDEVPPQLVQAYSKLLGDYRELVRLSREDQKPKNFYDEMEREALGEVKGFRSKRK